MNREIAALQFVSPVEREIWVKMAMALRSEFGELAYEAWLEWSAQAKSFRLSDARAVWRSCDGTGITIASLFEAARQQGWRDSDAYAQPTQQQRDDQARARAERDSDAGREAARAHAAAASRAAWVMHQCVPERHAYLDSKGFRDEVGLVWRKDESNNILCIPMRKHEALAGVQMIGKTGQKLFLRGQEVSGATYTFANKGTNILCEGYATALSIRAALHVLKMRYTIHVCFSASNLKTVAAGLEPGLVIADHDASGVGENAAKATRWRYFMPATVGDDFNDLARKIGIQHAAFLHLAPLLRA